MYNIRLTANGDIEIADQKITLVYDNEMWMQALKYVLQTRMGEYFLNTLEGLDFGVFFEGKTPEQGAMADAVNLAARQIPVFHSFENLWFEQQEDGRGLVVGGEALLENGSRMLMRSEVVV